VIVAARIHPTAIVEDGVHIGSGSSVWDGVHVRHGATIGEDCIIGEKTYVAYDVQIGNRVKLNAAVYICAGVTIEDGVMISAGTVFTNDRFPRAATNDLRALRTSEPDDRTLQTRVCAGATIGANATIGCGITIGRYAMIGMGSVVTKSIPDHYLALGNPARFVGLVCRCGERLATFDALNDDTIAQVRCAACGDGYRLMGRTLAYCGETP
jgi:UDP-2-acetamido-3-amino-2,3-dideoxy-glucuronate N-acetyltransferase